MFLGCGHNSIRFRPPALIIEKIHIDEGLTILENISCIFYNICKTFAYTFLLYYLIAEFINYWAII